jgi:hypothetical protein
MSYHLLHYSTSCNLLAREAIAGDERSFPFASLFADLPSFIKVVAVLKDINGRRHATQDGSH